jgi:hypothetical protein
LAAIVLFFWLRMVIKKIYENDSVPESSAEA